MKKTKKTGTVVQAVRNNLYIMGFALRICPSRVVFSGIRSGLDQFEYLFFSGYFLKRCSL